MKPESGFFLSNPFKPSGFGSIFSKSFVLLASHASVSWNTLLQHLKTLDSLRQSFTAT
jgi:hypothetical protein